MSRNQLSVIGLFLPFLVFSTVLERFNVFIPQLDFSLKLSLILLPVVGLVLFLKRRLVFNATFLFPFLALAVLAQIVSIPFSFDPFQSFQVVVFTLLMIGFFYLIVWSVRSAEVLTRLVWAWGAGAVAVALLGFWQFGRFLLGQDPALFFDRWVLAKTLPAVTFIQDFFGRTFLRPSSTFIDVNTSASFVGIFILLGSAWLLSMRAENREQRTESRKTRTSYLILLTFLLISLVYFILASSRTAALGLAVGAATLAYLLLREKIGKKLLAGGLVLLLAGLIGGMAYFSSVDPARSGSAVARLDYARAAVEMLKRSSWAGVGAGNFEPYYTQVLKPGAEAGYSHSILLTWLGELGVGGTFINLLLIGVVVLFLWRILNFLKSNSVWYIRVSGLLAGFLALVFANVFHAHYGLEFTWVLLGLAVAGYYVARSEIRDQRSGNRGQGLGRVDVLGVQVDNITMGEAVDKVKEIFRSGKKGFVATPNPEMVMQSRGDEEFRKILNAADISVPDGAGLIWASRIWGTPLKERVTGTDLFLELCAEASRRGGRVLFLEGPEGLMSSEEAARKLKQKYPKLDIAGTLVISRRDDKKALSAIKEASRGRDIDLLFVAYGHGKQEPWIKRNLPKIPVKVAVGVGGALDFAAGVQIRAPRVVRALGLEWFYRLARQPNRLKRQVYALVPFIFLTFRKSLKR
ncbi:MAG: hypothetical protein BMS9Abin34_004 [Patescibacteria group bacterium]|nr:MAG: hypothetical protein BMS9Abin34_004 [Patescibacteria group bacterium]